MRIGRWKLQADWGHVAFVTGMVVVIGLYLADAARVSVSVGNLALVLPGAVLAVVLYLGIVAGAVRIERDGAPAAAAENAAAAEAEADEVEGFQQTRGDLLRAVVLGVGLGVYVLLYPLLRLEPATFLFIAGALWLLGVRRPLFVLVYAAVFTAIVIGGARALLSYPMPMLFF